MRRVWLLTVLFLVACANGGGHAPTSVASPPAATLPALKIGDTATLPDGETIAVRALEAPVAAPAHASGDRDIVGVDVEWCAGPNPADGRANVTGAGFLLILPDNTRVVATPGEKQPVFGDMALAPNACSRGWVTFTSPKGARPRAVVYHTLRWEVG